MHRAFRLSVSVSILVPLCLVASAGADVFKDERNVAWRSHRDLTDAQFAERFRSARDQGFLMIDVDAYATSSGIRYAGVWRENTDRRGWAEHRDMTSARYSERWEEYRDRGFRPLDVEAYRVGSRLRFAGIWVENRERLRWTSHRGLTGTRYGEIFRQRSREGFRLADMEAYETGNGLRFAAIWLENRDGRDWAQLRGMDRERYQREVEQRAANGFVVTDFEAYRSGGATRYAAIWERKSGFAFQVRTNRTARQFANLWRQYRDEGYRLIDFERYPTSRGDRYGGVWVENNDRFRLPEKARLDRDIQSYRRANNLPGISVAIVRDGEMIYRRGFGFADVENGKVAHGGSIYGLASVSKVIGGTLAARLASRGRLANGRRVDLDLTAATASYVDGLPARHRHTLEQLFSHTGCVVHYNTTPAGPNPTRHFTTALAAGGSFWNLSLVTQRTDGTACLVRGRTGQRRSYSTHAFTLIGAALEAATGRRIARLVNEEIGERFGLETLRTMYTTSRLPADYDRVRPYRLRDRVHTPNTSDFSDPPHSRNNPNVVTRYSNNSWKVLGGGLEASAADLARFGWLTLSGRIVDPATRDNLLFRRVSTASGNGIAWMLGTNGGRRIAEHGGSARGMRSHLRVYRDDGLVIAVLTNRTTHRSDLRRDLPNLVTTLASRVLR